MAKVTLTTGDVIEVKGFTAEQFKALSPDQQMREVERAVKGFDGYDKLSTGLRTFLGQGMAMGFGDEIEAGLRAPFSDRSYKDIRDELRGDLAEFGDEHPVIKGGLEVAGAVATPGLGTLGLAKTGAKAVTKAGGMLANIGKATAAGGVTGAIAGVGTSDAEDAIGMAKDAGKGFVVGGLTGGTTTGLVRGGKGVYDHVTRGLGSKADDTALRKIYQTLRDEGLSPSQAAKRLREIRARGTEDAMLADIGSKSRATTRSALDRTAERTSIDERIAERYHSQAGNISDNLSSAFEQGGGLSPSYLRDIASQQQLAARIAYPKAYRMAVSTQPIRELVDDPIFRRVYKDAVELVNSETRTARMRAAQEGLPVPDEIILDSAAEDLLNAQYVPTELLHKIKIGLYKMAQGTKREGKMSPIGERMNDMQREINNYLKRVNGGYKAAQEEFADFAGLQEAFDLGINMHRIAPKELAERVRELAPSQKVALRHGLFERISGRAADMNDNADFVKEVFGSPKKRSMLRYAFDDDAAYERFKDYIGDQAKMVQTKNTLHGGSPTARRIHEDEDFSILADILIDSATTGGFSAPNAISRWARQGWGRAGGVSPQASQNIAEGMTSIDPKEQMRLLRQLSKLPLEAEKRALNAWRSPVMHGGMVGGMVAPVTGLLSQ